MKQYNRDALISFFDEIAHKKDYWYERNGFYHNKVHRLVSSFIPAGKSVLEIGCATGTLLAGLSAARGVGVDISSKMIKIAKGKYPDLEFINADVMNLELLEKFDYIVLSELTTTLFDVWKLFRKIEGWSHSNTMIIITAQNPLWDMPIKLLEFLKLKQKSLRANGVFLGNLKNILNLAHFEVVNSGHYFFGMFGYIIAKPIKKNTKRDISCSVIIPTRNEIGNIEECVKRMPDLANFTELIFVDGDSTDGTVEEIKRMQRFFQGEKNIKLLHQKPTCVNRKVNKMLLSGKGDAVRMGFEAASGEILMILDSDLSVAPEDLPKFYCALSEGKAKFANGSRMIYPQEKDAMRFLNYLANKFFSAVFSWLLGQHVSDTLCGTKVLFKKDYEKIKINRKHFGEFDPFGDFDLLFGASKLGLKIVDIPVRYYSRKYGKIKIERFKHGILLLKMSFVGFMKLKLKI